MFFPGSSDIASYCLVVENRNEAHNSYSVPSPAWCCRKENDPEVVFFPVSHRLHWLSIVHLVMVEQFLRHVQQNNLFLSRDKILLAVSGGRDSMALLDAFAAA